ncbi:CBS domain-containing protein [Wolbachia endosymbiont of Litomosoides brasiliensis]|uniref:transporter associated domain-containing protein n=1 Tax=Wolbachia endosymbiont of Litomosoides brasiliensis TaxID=1812117 RepID=UPI00158BD38E|nr:transporter associated domain-containing protein [Wolbachia endosymbiont of Litomosoides brasiliensis]NUY39368.1 CBS domain-containing protein [Wolbachia endosymbiont of Litomosoides brasiliensis]
MSKKRTLIEEVVYRAFLFLFKKIRILKKCATEALMEDIPDLSIFNGLLKFHDCNIIDIMTPRTEICAVDIESSRHEIIKKVKGTCLTKILIYKNNFDNVIGFFYIKDVFFSKDKNFNLRSIIQNVIFVPPSMKTTSLFVKMRSSRSHLAVVLDEYGGTDGLISMTDLMGKLMPSVSSGNEPFEHVIVELSQNKYEVSARAPIRDIEENLEIELRDPEEDYATLGGLIFSIAGRVPSVGETIEYKNGIKFIIKDANERYINKVILNLSDYES